MGAQEKPLYDELPEDDLGPEDLDDVVDELKAGSRLFHDQYTIIDFLNSGGFGITYLAKDSLDRTVVIKECFPNTFCRRSKTIVRSRSRALQADFRAIVRLFMQEARSLSKLVHPNIVGVHQVFEDNDTAYMAIDYIDGLDLLEMIEKSGKVFTPDEIVAQVRKLLAAIQFIHESGVLHRDISPDNILIKNNREPVLIDFGAAREQASKQSRALSALRVVKEGYSPQEFYISDSLQAASSDLYSLAASYYHVITGAPPPNSQKRLAAIADGTGDPYRPLEGRFSGYPQNFLAALDKAAKVLPRERIASAGEWLAMLEGPDEVETSARIDSAVASILAEPSEDDDALGSVHRVFPSGLGPGPTPLRAVDPAAARALTRAKAQANRKKFPIGVAALLGSVALIALGVGYAVLRPGAGPGTVAPPALAAADTTAPAVAAPEAQFELQLAVAETAPSPAAAGLAADVPEVASQAAMPEASAGPGVEVLSVAPPGSEGRADIAAKAESAPVGPAAELPLAATPVVAMPAETVFMSASAADPIPADALAVATVVEPVRDPMVAPDQVADAQWEFSIPFDSEAVKIGDDPFPVVTSLAEGAKASGENSWLQVGVTIYAVNDEWVSDQNSIIESIEKALVLNADHLIQASARVRDPLGGSFQQVTLSLPTVRLTTLANGVTVRSAQDGGVWLATVMSVADATEGGVRPGDVLSAERLTGLAVDTPESFETIIEMLAQNQLPEAMFDAVRGGERIAAALPLARKE